MLPNTYDIKISKFLGKVGNSKLSIEIKIGYGKHGVFNFLIFHNL